MTQSSYAKECLWIFCGKWRCISSCKTNVILPTLLSKTQVYYWTKNVQKHPLCILFLCNADPCLKFAAWAWPLANMDNVSISLWQLSELSKVHLLYLLYLIKSKLMHFFISFSSLIRTTITFVKDIVCFHFQFPFTSRSAVKH